MEIELKAIGGIYKRIQDAKEYLFSLQTPYLNPEDLQKPQIQASMLDINSKSEDKSEPQYCRPYPTNEFNAVFENYVNSKENRLEKRTPSISPDQFEHAKDNMSLFNHILSELSDWKNGIGGGLGWVERPIYKSYRQFYGDYASERAWMTGHLWLALPLPRKSQNHKQKKEALVKNKYLEPLIAEEMLDRSRLESSTPPLAFSLASSWTTKDTILFRCELIAALAMMASHVRDRAMGAYNVQPIFVYSFSGNQARVLQVHLDYQLNKFFVRMSPWIVVETQTPLQYWRDEATFRENDERIKLLLRWMANTPLGNEILMKETSGDVHSVKTRWNLLKFIRQRRSQTKH